MDKKYIHYGTIVVALFLACLYGAWPSLAPPVQAAMIGAAVTVVSGAAGAGLLFWQIGRQAQNAIGASRATEAMKLKRDVYLDIVKACREALDAQSEVTSYIQRFEYAITGARSAASMGLAYSPPDARAMGLSKLYFEASDKMIDLISLQERWEIIDPRSKMFRSAFGLANQAIANAWSKYFEMSIREMPHQMLDGKVLPWSVPDIEKGEAMRKMGDELRDGFSLQGCYVQDFQTEMQNALLGELFDRNEVPARDPIDPKFRPIRLDQFDELMTYFENTDYGRHNAAVEAQARAQLGKLPS